MSIAKLWRPTAPAQRERGEAERGGRPQAILHWFTACSQNRDPESCCCIARPSPTPKLTLCSVLLVNPNVDVG